jgi:hypothetical protein
LYFSVFRFLRGTRRAEQGKVAMNVMNFDERAGVNVLFSGASLFVIRLDRGKRVALPLDGKHSAGGNQGQGRAAQLHENGRKEFAVGA